MGSILFPDNKTRNLSVFRSVKFISNSLCSRYSNTEAKFEHEIFRSIIHQNPLQ